MTTVSTGTTAVSTGGVGSPQVAEYGLVSNLNTQQIIQAELQPYQIPITNLQNEQSTLSSQVADYQQINTDLLSMSNAGDNLASPGGWTAKTATSSNTAVATATAAAGTPSGSVSFAVTQLAQANTLVSSGTIGSPSQIITNRPDLLISEGAGQLGFSTLANGGAGSALSLGNYTISVTQASQAASTTGSVNLSGGATITAGTNDTVSVTAGSTTYNLQIAAGSYSSSGLLSAINQAMGQAKATGVLQAGYDADGHLILSTVAQGSSQTLTVNTANSTLGIAAGSSTGVDGVVTVDGQSNTLSDIDPAAGPISLTGANGATLSATLSGLPAQQFANSSLVTLGSVTASNISTGSGSLIDVVDNINNSGTGIVASDVQTGTGQYVLQLSASSTGAANDLSLDTSAFSGSTLGSLRTAAAGQNAQLQVGGAAGYMVSSPTDTFSGLLPGLSITASQVSTNPVTVTVGADVNSITSSVGSFVSDANQVLNDLLGLTGYNSETKTGGPLMGSAILEGLQNGILNAVASSVGTSKLGSASNLGITISNGTLSFDQSKFAAAYQQNPAQVQALFTQGGTFSPSAPGYSGQVTFGYASTNTRPGSYAVSVSHSATQASTTGAALAGGSVGAGETLGIAMGSATATYTTTAGQSLTSIAAGLNASFASQSMAMSAQVVNGNQLELMSSGYGSAQSFSVTTSNSGAGTLSLTAGAASSTFTGTDVEGTINGVAATGTGQFLAAPSNDPTLQGLSVEVTTPGITSATDLGSFSYQPGLAQVMSSLARSMTDPSNGAISRTVKGLQNQSSALTPQIQMYQNIVQQQNQLLMAEYATMESNLNTLKGQSSALAGELAQIEANSGVTHSSSSGG